MIKHFVMLMLGVLLLSNAHAATVVSVGDTISSANIIGGFTDSYSLFLSVNTDIEINGSYSNMTFPWTGDDFFILEVSGGAFTQGWAGDAGALNTGMVSLPAGAYTLGVSGVGFAPGGTYNLAVVPLPAAFWLFISALAGWLAVFRR